MAYTPELSPYHSGTLRRISWALGKPMTRVIESIFDNLDLFIDPDKICEKCRDKSRCESCYFHTGRRVNEAIPIDPVRRSCPPRQSEANAPGQKRIAENKKKSFPKVLNTK